ncbi:hotdog family protein [Pseudoalteromonas sp. MMG024]|uniref:hotdog family protein n=1 Tax=Pseudoalteromonas sp. MMG024 TaxID=2909980 RepID=UPI001F2EDA8C|nr:hotdog family protein [Pseudoalteromonas sp. MMG024]MCF6455950.1 hotdog family protein [Pseudoalteromonas sp. MMG024]
MTHYSIEAVLPHADPMILLTRLVSYDQDSAVCEVDISAQSAFFNEQTQSVASYIGTEYMAQSIAAYAGALALDDNAAVKIGFLIGSRKYKTFTPEFTLRQTLAVSVKKLFQEETGLSVFECQILHADTVLAEAKINVFQPDDPVQFLKEQQ